MRAPLFLAALTLILAAGAARADEDGAGPVDKIKQGVKEAAHAVGNGARAVGHAVKGGAKEGWDKSREGRENVKSAAREAGGAVRDGTKATGQAVKKGAKGAWHGTKAAVKGEDGAAPEDEEEKDEGE